MIIAIKYITPLQSPVVLNESEMHRHALIYNYVKTIVADVARSKLIFSFIEWRTCCNFICCFLDQATLNQTLVGAYVINVCNNPHIEV